MEAGKLALLALPVAAIALSTRWRAAASSSV
jgi:hypothetical protein